MDSNDVLFEEIEVTKVEGYSSESEIETFTGYNYESIRYF